MTQVQKISRVAMVVLVAGSAAACGNAASQLSPTGPSVGAAFGGAALEGFAASLTTGSASVAGKGGDAPRKGGDAPGKRIDPPGGTGRRDNNRVEVVGRVTTVDASVRTLEIRGVVVTVPTTATIRHGSRVLELDSIAPGDMVQVKGSTGPGGILATEVKVEQRKGKRDDDEGDLLEEDETGEGEVGEDDGDEEGGEQVLP